jgi:multiple sugar transport system substrate-binding protein
LAGAKLRLVVVADPAMASIVRQLQGEWNAQTGAEVDVEEATEKTLASGDSLPGDAVLCPSHLLGPWAERRLVAPVPDKLLRAGASNWPEIFEQVRIHTATWRGDPVTVPFGSPVLICYYRADLLEKLGRQPPRTWAEYQELAELLNRQQDGKSPLAASQKPLFAPLHGAIEPLGPGWAGLTLLARAAAYAKHRDNDSTLFDVTTMEPLVAGPPFVRALTELAAAAKLGPAEQLQYDPAAVRAAFWQGRCGMAITWPSAAGETPVPGDPSFRVGFAELPGSLEVYHIGNKTWEARPDQDLRVPLVGASGRMGVVPVGSEQQEAAFHLLFWLSGQQSGRVCAASPMTTLFRQSQVKSPRDWVEKPVPTATATAYAVLTERTLRRSQAVGALAIPGRAEYLAALDEAVREIVIGRGNQSPADALARAARTWGEITKRLGVERQKTAYLRSLGLE